MFKNIEWLEFIKEIEKCEYIVCIGFGRSLKTFEKLFDENNLMFLQGIVHEDIFFCMESFTKAGDIVDIPQTCYRYRRRTDSISSKVHIDNLESIVIIYHQLMHLLQEYSADKKLCHALSTYVEIVTKNIINWMYYFPNYEKMQIGDISMGLF